MGSGEAIPSSLREFAQQHAVPKADIDMLAGIKFPGEAPRTPERWQSIYKAIVMRERTVEDPGRDDPEHFGLELIHSNRDLLLRTQDVR